MSKERLEEIQKDVNYAYRRDGSINTKAVTMHIEHYEHLYEQAERVQELESELNKQLEIGYYFEGETHDLAEQNKRYREVIEYVMTAKSTHYSSLENALEDIKYVINEVLERDSE